MWWAALFREFAVTLAVTILISAVVSLTLVPCCARNSSKQRPEKCRARKSGRWFAAVVGLVRPQPHLGLDHQRLTLWVASHGRVTVLLYILIPKGFFSGSATALIKAFPKPAQSIPTPAMAIPNSARGCGSSRIRSSQSVLFIGVDGNNVT